ncbi:MAG: hypothetical protein AB7O52_06580 [Planctomycetota bacterium]
MFLPMRHSIPRVAIRVAIAVVALMPTESPASTVLPLSHDQILARAATVFHGVCTHRHSYRDNHGLTVTRYRFQVLDTLKGEPVAERVCVQPGGVIGDIATVVPGLSPHATGDEVILFLENDDPTQGYTLPVCLDRGVYRVILDATGTKLVRGVSSELHTAHPSGSEPAATEPVAVFPEARLSDFKSTVRTRLRQLEGQEKR